MKNSTETIILQAPVKYRRGDVLPSADGSVRIVKKVYHRSWWRLLIRRAGLWIPVNGIKVLTLIP